MKKILVIYSYVNYSGSTTLEYLFSFKKYSNHKIYYLNLFFNKNVHLLSKVKFDAIFIHYTIFSTIPYRFEKYSRLLNKIEAYNAIKVAFFQDEWYKTDVYCQIVNNFNLDIVFSVAPEAEIPKMYTGVDFEKVKFHRILTCYIDEKVQKRIEKQEIDRDIDVFYRTNFTKKHKNMGSYILHKKEIAEQIIAHPQSKNLKLDISFNPRDYLRGFSWYKALLRAKYTLGIDSGVNFMDRDGSVQKQVNDYLLKYPNASFDEVKEACYQNQDDNISYFAISPRNIQACMTRTCQILLEGEYNGILKPNIHYIEVKKDYSNLDEVMNLMRNESFRMELVNNAYNDVVKSGKYTYQVFVDYIFEKINFKYASSTTRIETFFYYLINMMDKINWMKVWVNTKVTLKFYHLIVLIFSEKKINMFRAKIKI